MSYPKHPPLGSVVAIVTPPPPGENGWSSDLHPLGMGGRLWSAYGGLRPATPEELARVRLATLGAEDAL